ncbi:hypothetical protein BDZ97DRAFT_1774432 [Flammula alnicola]|nr:hypothetical protein BDZ97DRAFT_1774432 [Flammula alnicola]
MWSLLVYIYIATEALISPLPATLTCANCRMGVLLRRPFPTISTIASSRKLKRLFDPFYRSPPMRTSVLSLTVLRRPYSTSESNDVLQILSAWNDDLYITAA